MGAGQREQQRQELRAQGVAGEFEEDQGERPQWKGQMEESLGYFHLIPTSADSQRHCKQLNATLFLFQLSHYYKSYLGYGNFSIFAP